MERQGHFCFRYRSFIPLLVIVIGLLSLLSFKYPFGSQLLDQSWGIFCLLVGLIGFGIRVVTIGFVDERTSGRNRNEQVAASLNTTGVYSVVRNPLYFGNFFLGAAAALAIQSPLVFIIYLFAFILMYERIVITEEQFLLKTFGESYSNWAAITPAMIPRIRQWSKPQNGFNWKRTVREEYRVIFMLLLSLAAIEWITESIVAGEPVWFDLFWKFALGFAIASFLVIRFLSKKTSLLRDHADQA